MSRRRENTQQQIAAVRSVTAKLHAAEDAIDHAIIKLSELSLELPSARINAKLSATVAQPAFDNIGAALASLIQGRSQTITAHAALAETREGMGLGALARGDGWKIFQSAGEAPLAIVEDVAA
jgi:hypothetical protein